MDTIRFGIIGLGGRGGIFQDNNHLPDEGYGITAGADIDQNAIEKFAERLPNAKAFHDYRDLLKLPEIDAVFVITPDDLHVEMTVAAFKAGKHVFLEKPLAISAEGCETILRTAMETGRKLYVGHNMRCFPVILKMKELIDSGVIGEVQLAWCRHFINYGGDAYFHDWHSEREHTNGLLLQKGAHDIDVMHWLMNSYTTKVVGIGMLSVYDKCRRRMPGTPGHACWDVHHYPPEAVDGYSPIIDIEDSNMILMQLASGKQCAYLQCHYTPDSDRNYTFIGTKGRIENRGVGDNAQVLVWTHRTENSLLPDETYTLRGIPGTHSGADPAIMKNFREYIRFDAVPKTNPVEAMRAVLVGIEAHEAMRSDLGCRTIPEIAPEILEYFSRKEDSCG